ncbi:iron-containing redox enzyme family protein [Alicyclobacillus tolerans]|uniref:TenA family transcriptional regulator n=1 Tax=Alicyclobacillus tolerans TaxID=90970 RepID=UPI001F36794B|nr:iron-containing redox enzyme family protein [Alicyclobacillus tolerans]MCF8564915.1 iron-containing redox enzyme family protein [Alicyclobacillus tolerans]
MKPSGLQGTVHLATYEDVEREMQQVVRTEFHEADFFRTLAAGGYSGAQIRHFAIQYSFYSRNFPRVLGASIAAMAPMDSWWVPLADNLWDEAGRGQPGKSHEQLYKTFLLSVDPKLFLNDLGMPEDGVSPAVDQAIFTFLEFFRNASPLEAMAAVGLGSEVFAGDVMGTIARGLRHPSYNLESKLDLLFWDVHADEHEPRHYQLCKDILIQFTSQSDLQTMFEVGRSIAKSEAKMYQELHNEMVRL